MKSIRRIQQAQQRLRYEMNGLAERTIFGSVSETYRTCGQPGCRCKRGEKHGPHLDISFRSEGGKTTGYYVPQPLVEAVRDGVEAWKQFQALAREVAELNRERLWISRASPVTGERVRRRKGGPSQARPAKRIRAAAAGRGKKLWDPVLRRIDEVLEDEELVDLVAEALGRRRPGSQRKGRPSTPAEVAKPCLVTGIPALATIARDSYSKKRMDGAGG